MRDAACVPRARRCAAPRLALALACLALCVRHGHARSAAARASASGSGGGANSGIVQLVSMKAEAPLPPALQASAAAAFALAAATLAGTSLVCGDIGILQGGAYTRPADLGDGFSRLSPSASETIATLLAVRCSRAMRVLSRLRAAHGATAGRVRAGARRTGAARAQPRHATCVGGCGTRSDDPFSRARAVPPPPQAPAGTAVAVPAAQLAGVNVFLTSYIAANAGINVRHAHTHTHMPFHSRSQHTPRP
jgi:hypothetical protein